jgi:hypothetical protein
MILNYGDMSIEEIATPDRAASLLQMFLWTFSAETASPLFPLDQASKHLISHIYSRVKVSSTMIDTLINPSNSRAKYLTEPMSPFLRERLLHSYCKIIADQ